MVSIHVLLSGGGSGGHVFPALAVAEQLAAQGARVSFCGTANGPEARWVPAAGWDFHALNARAMVGRGWLAKLAAVATLMVSAVKARVLLGREGVQVVIATGGYACVPAAIAAWSRRIPLVLVEPNARPGVANRWLSRVATVAVVAHDRTADALHCPARTLGVPVRQGFTVAGTKNHTTSVRVLILGGSQGAETINRVLPEAISLLSELRPDLELEVAHQTGAGKAGAVRDHYAERSLDASVVEFVDDMPAAVLGAELVVSRAGAITLAELCAAGRPSLLLPLRSAAAGHQVDNARLMVEAGAAMMAEELSPQSLAAELEAALEPDRMASMAAAALSMGRPGAAAGVARLALSLAEEA